MEYIDKEALIEEARRETEKIRKELVAEGKIQADPTTTARVLEVLGYLDRPRNALATGVSNLQDTDPSTTFLGGLGAGIRDEKKTSWGDVLGVLPYDEDSSWGEYLTRGGTRFALDVAGDPLNLVGAGIVGKGLKGGAKALGIAEPIARVGEGIKNTGLYKGAHKAIGHSTGNKEIDESIARIMREGSDVEINEIAEKTAREAENLYKAYGLNRQDVFNLLERPQKRTSGVDYALGRTFGPLRDINKEQFNLLQRLRENLGMPVTAPVGEPGVYEYMPRILSGSGKWRQNKGQLKLDSDFKGRQLYKWVDETGEPVTFGKLDNSKTGVKEINGEYWYNDIPVEPRQLDLDEASAVAANRASAWIDDPTQALQLGAIKTQNKANFLRLLEAGLNEGWLRRGAEEAGDLRPLGIKGLSNVVANPIVANRLENLAYAMYDPDSVVGALDTYVSNMFRGPIGDALRTYTNWWKRNTLAPHPGFYVANMLSDSVLLFMSGIRNPERILEGAAVKAGKGQSILGGMSNKQLFKEFKKRGLVDKDYGNIAGGLDDVTNPTKIPYLDLMTKNLGIAGRGIQKTGEGWRKFNDWMFKNVGGSIEDTGRLTAAIDWLKKNVKGAPTPGDLDRAAMHAKKYLFDYGDLTPLEDTFKNIVPFYAFSRKMIGRFLEDLLEQPQNLANIERFLEFVGVPMSQYEKDVADPWISESGPLMGLFGARRESEEGDPLMLQTQRFVPFGQLEQFTSRPGEAAMGMVNPALKLPFETLGNYSSFKGRAIDPIADSGFDALTAPITGGAYAQAEGRTGPFSLPAAYEHLLYSTPIGRHLRTIDTLGEGALWDEPGREPMSAEEKAVYGLTGGKQYPYDQSVYERRRQTEKEKQIAAIRRQITFALRKGDVQGAMFYKKQLQQLMNKRGQSKKVEPAHL